MTRTCTCVGATKGGGRLSAVVVVERLSRVSVQEQHTAGSQCRNNTRQGLSAGTTHDRVSVQEQHTAGSQCRNNTRQGLSAGTTHGLSAGTTHGRVSVQEQHTAGSQCRNNTRCGRVSSACHSPTATASFLCRFMITITITSSHRHHHTLILYASETERTTVGSAGGDDTNPHPSTEVWWCSIPQEGS